MADDRDPPIPVDDEPASSPPPLDARVQSAISGLRFGSVELVVHEGRVVQIVRTEKLRLDR